MAAITIATWNVNSIRARLERVLAWLESRRPDIVCLQELKVVAEDFPYEALSQAGYHSAVHGQKTYNGVAILSRTAPEDVRRGFADEGDESGARLISAAVSGIRVLSVYVPNGREVGTEHYAYKLEWLRTLREHLEREDIYSPTQPVVLCGDLNVAVDDKDVARPEEWGGSVLCHEDVRDALAGIRDWGFVDVFRMHYPEGGVYSWWDYRALGFPRNNGLRIDHIYATSDLAKGCKDAFVDRDERKGVKPSDHAPVAAVFELT